ncbi:MAG: right-handed parallel beta-helix repeat-containing protein [Planctomycetes bacterium]|nr:right-handed parallel beta-helix repeat-containing protein [Planctomycetota bacterium]
MKKNMTVFICLALVLLIGCTGTKEKGFPGNPPKADLNIQRLIDNAKDGDVVDIPYGRYILKEGLKVKNRINLKILCQKGTQIFVDDVNEAIISIENSRDILLENAHLRHLKPLEEYECHGGVVVIRESSKTVISNCDLNGCGAIGVHAEGSNSVTIEHCYIHDNTFTAFYINNCDDVKIRGNIIEDNAGFLNLYKIGNMEMSDNLIQRNGGYWGKKELTPGLKK